MNTSPDPAPNPTPDPTPDPAAGEILLRLLEQAATAHGVHEREELGGVYDEAWPEWYAAHMARALAEQGYRIVPAADGDEESAYGGGIGDLGL